MQDHTREQEKTPHVRTSETSIKDAKLPIFAPRAYLMRYYQTVDPGNQALLRFYSQVYKDLAGRSMLEFGGGPTIYSLITAARTASWIHFCDYNAESLSEVKEWLRGDASAFDWTPYVRFALECETGGRAPLEEDVRERERQLRQKVRKISSCNIFAEDPLLGASEGPYGVVAQTFVLDNLTDDKNEWIRFNRKLTQLVQEDGLFVTVTLLHASYWTLEDSKYLAVSLSPDDVSEMYSELGFKLTHLAAEPLAGKIGYDGFILACGQRS